MISLPFRSYSKMSEVENQPTPDLAVDGEPGSSEEYPPSISAILQKKGTGDIDDVEVAQVIEYVSFLCFTFHNSLIFR